MGETVSGLPPPPFHNHLLCAGEVTKHGDLKCVCNEGMPIYKAPLEKGSLVIQFLVSACVLFSWDVFGGLIGKGRNNYSLSHRTLTGHLS